jgi:hypothetical protein
MNKSLPEPDGKNDLLPKRNSVVMVRVFHLMNYFWYIYRFIALFMQFFEQFERLKIFLVDQVVINLKQICVLLQKSEEHFVLCVLDREILSDVQFD